MMKLNFYQRVLFWFLIATNLPSTSSTVKNSRKTFKILEHTTTSPHFSKHGWLWVAYYVYTLNTFRFKTTVSIFLFSCSYWLDKLILIKMFIFKRCKQVHPIELSIWKQAIIKRDIICCAHNHIKYILDSITRWLKKIILRICWTL